jgi:hypothetical protein
MNSPAPTQTGTGIDIETGALVSRLTDLMAQIIALIERETELVRLGRLNDATALEAEKGDLAREYMTLASRITQEPAPLKALAPERLAALRRRHGDFQALLQINLTVLATAHAVAESILRGAADELSRKASPQSYNETGQHPAPAPHETPPLTLDRKT